MHGAKTGSLDGRFHTSKAPGSLRFHKFRLRHTYFAHFSFSILGAFLENKKPGRDRSVIIMYYTEQPRSEGFLSPFLFFIFRHRSRIKPNQKVYLFA